jgi:hypothetical protein
MLVKRFAQIIGVVLILVGLVGLVLGDKLWLGILNIDIQRVALTLTCP